MASDSSKEAKESKEEARRSGADSQSGSQSLEDQGQERHPSEERQDQEAPSDRRASKNKTGLIGSRENDGAPAKRTPSEKPLEQKNQRQETTPVDGQQSSESKSAKQEASAEVTCPHTPTSPRSTRPKDKLANSGTTSPNGSSHSIKATTSDKQQGSKEHKSDSNDQQQAEQAVKRTPGGKPDKSPSKQHPGGKRTREQHDEQRPSVDKSPSSALKGVDNKEPAGKQTPTAKSPDAIAARGVGTQVREVQRQCGQCCPIHCEPRVEEEIGSSDQVGLKGKSRRDEEERDAKLDEEDELEEQNPDDHFEEEEDEEEEERAPKRARRRGSSGQKRLQKQRRRRASSTYMRQPPARGRRDSRARGSSRGSGAGGRSKSRGSRERR